MGKKWTRILAAGLFLFLGAGAGVLAWWLILNAPTEDLIARFREARVIPSVGPSVPDSPDVVLRELSLSGRATPVLLLRAGAQVVYQIRVPPGGVLSFAVAKYTPGGTSLIAKIFVDSGRRDLAYARTLPPLEEDRPPEWINDEVILSPYEGEEVRVILTAEVSPGQPPAEVAWRDLWLAAGSVRRGGRSGLQQIVEGCQEWVEAQGREGPRRIPRRPIKAVYYFQPFSGISQLWTDLDLRLADRDFALIRKDGFNAIILPIPWGIFQERIPRRFSDRAFDRLDRLIRLADRHGLGVILRVGSHERVPVGSLGLEYVTAGVLTNHADFLAYLGLFEEVGWRTRHQGNLLFYFWSWEDIYQFPKELFRLVPSNRLDFVRWLRAKAPLEYWNDRWGERSGAWREVELPEYFEAAGKQLQKLRDFWEFHDEDLIRSRALPCFLQALRRGNPAAVAASQPRVDYDHGYGHDRTFRLPAGYSFVATWFAPYMAVRDTPESPYVSAPAALALLKSLVRDIHTASGGVPLFFDQVFFRQFHVRPDLPRLRGETEEAEFMQGALSFLCRSNLVQGFALWTWRDYVFNRISNPGFEDGFEGWIPIGKPELRRERIFSGELSAWLDDGNYLQVSASTDGGKPATLAFYAAPAGARELHITSTWEDIKRLSLSMQTERIPLSFSSGRFKEFRISVKVPKTADSVHLVFRPVGGPVLLDEVQLYQEADTTGLYTSQGKPRAMRDLVAALNHKACQERDGDS